MSSTDIVAVICIIYASLLIIGYSVGLVRSVVNSVSESVKVYVGARVRFIRMMRKQ